MLRCYEPAHIVGVSKTAYVLATPRCLDWRRDLQRTSTNNDPSDSDSQDPRRRPARRHRGDRRSPRLPVAGVLVLDGVAASPVDVLRSEHRGALGEADGAVPDGTTVFDDEIPGVANLDPALLGALRRAATDAADDGVEFVVDSGWRSPAYQEQLLREAISKYGSEAEAARWVATPNTSAHVSGDAVDIGPADATAWLSAARRRVRAVPDLRQRALALRTAPRGHRSRLPSHVRRPDARSKDAAVTMRERLRPLAALAMVALIGAGCGSNAPSETGTAGTGTASASTGRQEAHRSGQGGEVRRVHPGARRQRLPRPGREERLRHTGSA